MNLEESYDFHLTQGSINYLNEIPEENIKLLISDAGNEIASAKNLIKKLNKNSTEWKNVFNYYYDSIYNYTDALLLLKKIKCNSSAIFTVLCIKYPHLELEWDFLERLKAKKEEPQPMTQNDWKSIELRIQLYSALLKEELEKNYTCTIN